MGQKIKQSQTLPEIMAPSIVKESYIIEEEVDELIEEESLISTSPSNIGISLEQIINRNHCIRSDNRSTGWALL